MSKANANTSLLAHRARATTGSYSLTVRLRTGTDPLTTRDDLSMAYPPGVGRVSMALAEHRRQLNPNYIIPSVFDPGITTVVARAIVRQEED